MSMAALRPPLGALACLVALAAVGLGAVQEPKKGREKAFETNGAIFSGGMEIGWDYGDNQMGLPPSNWGQINQACEMGEEQSPIDIETAKVKVLPSSPDFQQDVRASADGCASAGGEFQGGKDHCGIRIHARTRGCEKRWQELDCRRIHQHQK